MDWLTVQIIDSLTPSKVVRIRLETTLVCADHGLLTRWSQDDGLFLQVTGVHHELPAKFQDGGREVRWAECNQFLCVTKQLILFGLLLNKSCQGTETAYNNATSVLTLFRVHNRLLQVVYGCAQTAQAEEKRKVGKATHFPELLCCIA